MSADGVMPAPQRTSSEVLADAVRVLTEAARLTWTHERDGVTIVEPCDWAEFVTLALAGAAANIGSIEAALAGRPGSWEADGVRNLLTSTVGHDEAYLLEHRTEPVIVDLYVDEILSDLDAWAAYDDAQRELQRRYLQTTTLGAVDAIGELEERLEQQRLQDWAEYGERLRTAVEAAAAEKFPTLPVPVVVTVDTETYRRDRPEPGPVEDLLVALAVVGTELPGGGRSPLERLEASS